MTSPRTDRPCPQRLRALARQLRDRAKVLADAADIFDGFDLVSALPSCACGRPELTPCPHIVTGM